MPVKTPRNGNGGIASGSKSAIASGIVAETLDRRRLSDQITAKLEQLIVSGQLKTGETLPSERDLMTLFGVGRTSIRESLFALQRKGVVSAQPGMRPVVSEPNAEAIVAELSGTVRLFLATEPGMREFQRARRFFEPAIARFAATHAVAADRDRMAHALGACDAARGTPEQFVDADVDFHFAIVQATHSSLLIALHRAVLDWLREQRISSIEPAGSSHAAQRAHRKVFEAIVAADPDAAERAMLEHLDQVESYYWKARRARASRDHPQPRASRTPAKRRRNR